jgi:arylsulfatase A-like enzyme
MSGGRLRRAAITAGAAALLVAICCGAAASAAPDGERQGAVEERPNIVVIVTDDQDTASFTRKLMPKTFGLMDGGTRLTNFTIATPLCCPSRAAQLTGQYGHNNGVLSNHPGYQMLRDPRNVLPAWLRRSGYETAHVGRYLNGYRRAARDGHAAPGWDRWISLLNLHYRDYDLSVDGRLRTVHGDDPRSYVTRDLHRRTNGMLRDLIASDDPFYLQLDELAPHSDHLARGTCDHSALPGPRGFKPIRGADGVHVPADPTGEGSVADKPSYIRELPRIGPAQREAIQRRMRCRAAAIAEADRGIGELIGILRRQRELDDTAFVFYSDNGFFDGQHRIVKSKGLPYEESIQVPAMIRVPRRYLGHTAPDRIDLPASNIDVAPTVLDLAGAEPCIAGGECRRLDGRSLLDALDTPDGSGSWSPDRPILIEVDQKGKVAVVTLACTYAGVRVGEQVYVDYERVVRRTSRSCRDTDESEHYRLDRDPHERHNLWPPDNAADRQAHEELRATLERLRSCSGNRHLSAALQPPATGTSDDPCE